MNPIHVELTLANGRQVTIRDDSETRNLQRSRRLAKPSTHAFRGSRRDSSISVDRRGGGPQHPER
jgi:hypothetical protein